MHRLVHIAALACLGLGWPVALRAEEPPAVRSVPANDAVDVSPAVGKVVFYFAQRPSAAASVPRPAAPRALVVPDSFATIAQAMPAARSGDTIHVKPGTYRKSIAFKDGVSLVDAKPGVPNDVGVLRLGGGQLFASRPSLTPDGQFVVGIVGADGSGLRQVTQLGANQLACQPCFSPDGQHLVFTVMTTKHPGPMRIEHLILQHVTVNLFTVHIQSGRVQQITNDGLSWEPAWGL